MLLPDGNLMFTGGIYNDHFQPTAAAYIVYVGSQPSDEMAINMALGWNGCAATCYNRSCYPYNKEAQGEDDGAESSSC